MKSILLILLSFTAFGVAQGRPPRQLTNAKLTTRSAASGLAPAVNQIIAGEKGPLWIGYAVPVIAGEHHMCCFDDFERIKRNQFCCGGCRLDREKGDAVINLGHVADCPPKSATLEAANLFYVLFRAQNDRLNRVRSYSEDCALEAGGLPVFWLTDVRPSESVSFLASRARSVGNSDDEDSSNEAIDALALHADPSAEATLRDLMAPANPEHIREHAAFWLGSSRGKAGFEAVRDAFQKDSNPDFREQAIFAMSESKEPEAEQELIRIARSDRDSETRGKALFWLAQKAGKKVEGVITEAIENDPETEVKKKAVFSITQMPDSEGVPLLISVAKTNKNPVVRKEAIFWLGQSEDPRALDYIASLLK